MVSTIMVHPMIMKVHKNLPGDIPNIFLYQHFILSYTDIRKFVFKLNQILVFQQKI